MCGIAGIMNYHQSLLIDKQALLRIRDYMRFRGPDGAGLWISEDMQIGLAHRRLAIIDLSEAAAQPMASDDGYIHIVFNGEIYNYKELRNELIQAGHHFRTDSDTEVLIKLYQQQGEGFVIKLRGMFAFALFDTRQQRLILARDPFGIKPLYYADDGKRIQFASQVKALLAGGLIDSTIDPAGQVGFFLWGNIPEPYTLYHKIRSIEPGTLMVVDKNTKPKCITYHRPLDSLKQFSNHEKSNSTLRDIVFDSIRKHLVADVPVGAFLSAGIDSAAICSLAMEAENREPLRTVTLGFQEYQGTGADEVPLAKETAHSCGAQHQVRWVKRQDFEKSLEAILKSMDQPTIDGVNTWFVSKVTSETGLKVALSGVGGDEFFGGYSSFTQIPRLANKLHWIPKPFGRTLRWISSPALKRFTSPKYAGIFEYGSTFEGAYLLRRGLFMPWELPGLLDPDILREGWERLQSMDELSQTLNGIFDDYARVMALETRWYLQNRLLRDTDWASMAHSLEVRTPLVDAVLFQRLASSINGASNNSRPSKQDLASTPNLQLPAQILHRSKSGFSIPVRDWLLESAGVGGNERGLRGWAKFIAHTFRFEGLKK